LALAEPELPPAVLAKASQSALQLRSYRQQLLPVLLQAAKKLLTSGETFL
jgi:hypothetical protein